MTLIEAFAAACIVGILVIGAKVIAEHWEHKLPWDEEQ